MSVRFMFVYKDNPQDPCLQALKRWLPRLGFAVHLFGFYPHERQRGDHPDDRRISERLRQAAEHFQPTHLLAWVSYINLPEARWLKNTGVKVSMALNGVTSFSSGVTPNQQEYFELLGELDCYFIPHAPHVPVLRDLGVKAYEMPFFYDPAVFKPLPAWQRLWDMGGTDVIFIGNFGPPGNLQRPHREGLVRALGQRFRVCLLSDFKIEAPGTRWLRTITLPSVLNWLMNRSRIALNFDFFPDVMIYNSRMTDAFLPYTERDQFTIRSRVFTAIGAGIACMVERHPQIQRFFEDGKEIILWSTVDEAVERAAHYLSHPDELSAIARRGHAKAANLHTAPIRIQQLLTVMTSPTDLGQTIESVLDADVRQSASRLP